MEIKNIEKTYTFAHYVTMVEILIGKSDKNLYLEKTKKLFSHPQFYKDSCKVYFTGESLKKASEKFAKDSLWATFHPDWSSNFGKIVIRKNMEDVFITTNDRLALQILIHQTINILNF